MQMASVLNTTSRLLFALCAALVLLALSLATALAATPITVGGTAVVTNTDGDPIRVRENAGFEFTPVTVAWEGETVSVLAGPRTDREGNQWFKVQAPTGTGWMHAIYLQGASEPPAKATAVPTSNGMARVANTDGDLLRVRSAPNTEGNIIARLSPGATVTIRSGPVTDKAGITWYEITAGGISGWAMSQYLALDPASRKNDAVPQPQQASQVRPIATRTPAPMPAPAPTNALAPGGATSTRAQYRQWMEEARAMYPYRESVDKMWSVMMCESGGNAGASGGGGAWLGLFQYVPSTWRGTWNPYRDASIWDAKSQIFATAKAWSNGKQSWWSCY